MAGVDELVDDARRTLRGRLSGTMALLADFMASGNELLLTEVRLSLENGHQAVEEYWEMKNRARMAALTSPNALEAP